MTSCKSRCLCASVCVFICVLIHTIWVIDTVLAHKLVHMNGTFLEDTLTLERLISLQSLLKGSPAQSCSQIAIGDSIIAVNGEYLFRRVCGSVLIQRKLQAPTCLLTADSSCRGMWVCFAGESVHGKSLAELAEKLLGNVHPVQL